MNGMLNSTRGLAAFIVFTQLHPGKSYYDAMKQKRDMTPGQGKLCEGNFAAKSQLRQTKKSSIFRALCRLVSIAFSVENMYLVKELLVATTST